VASVAGVRLDPRTLRPGGAAARGTLLFSLDPFLVSAYRDVYDRAQVAFGGPAYDTSLSASGLSAIKDTILGGVNDSGARDAYNAVFGLVVSAYGWAYDDTLSRAALDALKDDALAWVADQGGIRIESRTPVSGGQFTVTLSKAGGVLVAFQPLSGGQAAVVVSSASALTHTLTIPALKAGQYRVIPVAFETPLTEGA
jgi:hypothetical protein